ncbi:hypothetical protein PR048_002571 [Dryococelus australis]|uniref:Uncharacterized protein n=1 Tax=Dryococelus australis TaxID=614101 RepID=A0ABQ9IKK5_9NEOP|nr:hypothetical protein PR048_002571 [Dryococelus australis]
MWEEIVDKIAGEDVGKELKKAWYVPKSIMYCRCVNDVGIRPHRFSNRVNASSPTKTYGIGVLLVAEMGRLYGIRKSSLTNTRRSQSCTRDLQLMKIGRDVRMSVLSPPNASAKGHCKTTRLPPRLNGFDSRRGRSLIFTSGNRVERCLWSAGFLGDLSFPALLNAHFTPFGSQYLDIKSCPNLCQHYTFFENCQKSALVRLVFRPEQAGIIEGVASQFWRADLPRRARRIEIPLRVPFDLKNSSLPPLTQLETVQVFQFPHVFFPSSSSSRRGLLNRLQFRDIDFARLPNLPDPAGHRPLPPPYTQPPTMDPYPLQPPTSHPRWLIPMGTHTTTRPVHSSLLSGDGALDVCDSVGTTARALLGLECGMRLQVDGPLNAVDIDKVTSTTGWEDHCGKIGQRGNFRQKDPRRDEAINWRAARHLPTQHTASGNCIIQVKLRRTEGCYMIAAAAQAICRGTPRCRCLAGFLRDLSPLHSDAAPYSPYFTHVGSQDLYVKNRLYLSTPHIRCRLCGKTALSLAFSSIRTKRGGEAAASECTCPQHCLPRFSHVRVRETSPTRRGGKQVNMTGIEVRRKKRVLCNVPSFEKVHHKWSRSLVRKPVSRFYQGDPAGPFTTSGYLDASAVATEEPSSLSSSFVQRRCCSVLVEQVAASTRAQKACGSWLRDCPLFIREPLQALAPAECVLPAHDAEFHTTPELQQHTIDSQLDGITREPYPKRVCHDRRFHGPFLTQSNRSGLCGWSADGLRLDSGGAYKSSTRESNDPSAADNRFSSTAAVQLDLA